MQIKDDLHHRGILCAYFLLTYASVLVNMLAYLKNIEIHDSLTFFFVAAVYLIYGLLYVGIAYVPIVILRGIASKRFCHKIRRQINYVIYALALILGTFVQLFIFTDKTIYQMYDFHLNSFVWNLITTRGGLESLGAGNSTMFYTVTIVLGFFLLQVIFLMFALFTKGLRNHLTAIFLRSWRKVALASFFLILGVFQGLTYGVSDMRGNSSVLVASFSFPLYIPIKFRHLAKSLGYTPSRTANLQIKAKTVQLKYPLQPIKRRENRKKFNIVWLVAESWRADMLNPVVMPSAWEFAQKSVRFTQHYSGGNGTRMGMFSMFYGLYGPYWFSFLAENRGPVLMDMLIEDDYQIKCFTSAKFSYPEFDRTIFARIPDENLVEGGKGPGWKCDRKNVTLMLDFINQRDHDKPFMAFMFFESPHAKYYFPKESIIKKDYLDDLNYATMDLEKDITLIKNRYINSCRHLDSQLERVLDYLRDNQLLDSTIVLLTGDHGEEFMEKGHWGHNSAFTEEQTHVPLVLYIPNRNPAVVSKMTSHLDIPATLLSYLGVTNPASDFSLGHDLFSELERKFTVISSWDSLCYVGQDYKIEYPIKNHGLKKRVMTTREDVDIQDQSDFFNRFKPRLVQTIKTFMVDLKKFSAKTG